MGDFSAAGEMGPVQKNAALVTQRMCWQRAGQEAGNCCDCYNINKEEGEPKPSPSGTERKRALDGWQERTVVRERQGKQLKT